MKTIIKLFSGRVNSLGELFELMFWQTGSMPSSHSAVVACVCTCVGFRSGIDSDIFIVSFILYFITIRDALGVRRSNGVQAHRLNEIVDLLNNWLNNNWLNRKKERRFENLVENVVENLPENPVENQTANSVESVKAPEPRKKLGNVKEVNGHTPMEVFVGSLLGIFIGIAFSVLN